MIRIDDDDVKIEFMKYAWKFDGYNEQKRSGTARRRQSRGTRL